MAHRPGNDSVPPHWNRQGFAPQGPLSSVGPRPQRSVWFVPALIFSVAVSLAFLFVATGILVAWVKQSEVAEPTTDPEPSRTAPAPPTPDPTTRSPEPSTPSPTPPPKKKKKKQKPPHLGKQRGYDPVPLPETPMEPKEASRFIQNNKVYRQKVRNSACKGLPSETSYPYGNVSKKTWRKVMQKTANCAREMWAGPVAKAGYQATYAKVTIFEGSVDSPCGVATAPGFYCPANQGIYLNTKGGGGGHPSQYEWMWYYMTMMHEYGHHVQARTGVLTAAWRWQSEQGANSDGFWRVSRRTELQANCFSGMGLRRSQAIDRGNFERYASNMMGEKEHGSAKNQYRWYRQGWQESAIKHCNTYVASGKEVG